MTSSSCRSTPDRSTAWWRPRAPAARSPSPPWPPPPRSPRPDPSGAAPRAPRRTREAPTRHPASPPPWPPPRPRRGRCGTGTVRPAAAGAAGRWVEGSGGDEDAAALEAAAVQVVHGVVDRVERADAGVQLHLALGGEDHQLGQVVVGADQVADHVPLGGDDVDGRDVDGAAVADDVVRVGPAGHVPPVDLRAPLADEVDHDLGALAAGQLGDTLDLVAGGGDS